MYRYQYYCTTWYVRMCAHSLTLNQRIKVPAQNSWKNWKNTFHLKHVPMCTLNCSLKHVSLKRCELALPATRISFVVHRSSSPHFPHPLLLHFLPSTSSNPKTNAIASAYSAGVSASNPVATPAWCTTMSFFGPALLCAIGIHPAVCISTTPIPKCSFHMVCRPAVASPNHRHKSEKGAFN